MTRIKRYYLLIGLLCIFHTIQAQQDNYSLIPYPTQLIQGNGSYSIHPSTVIAITEHSPFTKEAGLLAELFTNCFGKPLPVKTTTGNITLTYDASIEKDGYQVNISAKGVTLSAGTAAGMFMAVQTIRQLLPSAIEKANGSTVKNVSLPCLEIKDHPAFAWRGIHIDVSRHFFSLSYLEKLVDLMALYKLNKLHLHLTDDQGWRIEIKKYPKLTAEGAWREFNNQDSACLKYAKDNPDFAIDPSHIIHKDGKQLYGGFYTQQQMKAFVAYAASRHIDIIPEVDMPGHMMAAINSYTWLSCDSTSYFGKLFSKPICPCSEATMQFAKDIYSEIMDVFPSEYIHIGGDEVDRTWWAQSATCKAMMEEKGMKTTAELQAWFIREMEQFFISKGRKLIGWDEILEGGVSKSAAIMYWRTWVPKAPQEAAQHGNKVIMSPGNPLYFSETPDKNSLPAVYNYEIIPKGLSTTETKNIIGAQGNLWSEYIPTEQRADYLYMPRMMALAEITWSGKKEYSSFLNRLNAQYKRLDVLKVSYRLPDLDLLDNYAFTNTLTLPVKKPIASMIIRYTLDGTTPNTHSTELKNNLVMAQSGLVRIAAFKGGRRGDVYNIQVNKQELAKPETVANTKPGLQCTWYKKAFDSTVLIGGTPNGTFTVSSITVPKEAEAPSFSLQYRGYINVPEPGIYTFFLTSDDASRLKIADREVVNNDGMHAAKEKNGQVALEKGLHKFSLDFIEGGGGYSLQLQYSKDGSTPMEIPAAWFCEQAEQAKVFSKYNYYTSEQNVTILAEANGIGTNNSVLSVYNNNRLLATSVVERDNLLKASFPFSVLQEGKTELQYEITTNKTASQKGVMVITKLASKPNEVKIDLQTGGLVADGLPFFPFGFYCRPVENLPEQEVTHGFNMIGPYQSNLPNTLAERKAYMDRCAQVGIKVQYSINSLIGSGHNGAKGLDMTDEEKEQLLRSEIIAFRDHPALLSWYMNDEPDGQGRPAALLEKAYNLIHELDPYHPISEVFMLPSKFSQYRNTMDIAMTDPYPIPGPVSMVEDFVEQMNKDFNHEKSIWLVPQAFGGQELWTREPTAKEIRLMTYMGLIHSAKAIQYYTHAPGNLNPQAVSAWSVCSDMAVEVNQMSAFLLSDEASPTVTSNEEGVITKVFSYKGDVLIMVANKKNEPRSFSVELNGANQLQELSTASVWFENREVAFANGKINDVIDALGTRVYLLKAKERNDSLKAYTTNLVYNPGFEKVVSPGLPTGSNTKKSFPNKLQPGASFFIDPRQSVEGMFSLRLITPYDSTGDRIRILPIVLKAKNSYTVSIWAKAKQQAIMPYLRMNVEGPAQEKVFTLSNEWHQYAFTFNSNTAYTNAILSFDLLTAGTAWVDLVQVTPDPVISYSINKDNIANVAITTTMPNAVIQYNLDNKDYTKTYTTPFLLDKPATIKAYLLANNRELATAASFVPVNKALNKPVTLLSKYAPQYAGAGNASLTDGMMATTGFKDNKWLGFSGTDVIATIDMQNNVDINSVAANFLCDPNSGIFLPPQVTVLTSEDGIVFKQAGTYTTREVAKIGEEPHLRLLSVGIKKQKARYIKLVAKAFGEIPEGYLFKGTMSWIFIDEILVQ